MDSYIPLPGKVIPSGQLKIRWAKDLAYYLKSESTNFAKFVESRVTDDNKELIIVDIDVEIGQRKICDIRRIEPIVVVFSEQHTLPEVLSLRSDFPRVPHINLRDVEFPRSLCLFEERYEDLKLYWTSAFLIKRISEWLKLTAKGALHQDNQPLEPLMLGVPWEIIIPFDLFNKENNCIDSRLVIFKAGNNTTGITTLIAKYPEKAKENASSSSHVAIPIRGQVQVHGVINRVPSNLQELHDFLLDAQIDLIKEIRSYFTALITGSHDSLNVKSQLILIIDLPKKRNEASVAEASDVWSFILEDTIEKLGINLGVWDISDGKPGYLFNGSIKDTSMRVFPLKVVFSFSKEMASVLNNAVQTKNNKITLVGSGALGSQIFMNLIRAGYGTWTVIDHDRLLPHNLARHALYGLDVGYSKAECLSMLANNIFDEQETSKYIIADILNPNDKKGDVESSMKESDAIIDISTSIAVARYLTRDVESKGRRVSLFLNPSGEDSVMLIEDKKRQISLDLVEMQYYRLLLHNDGLKTHLTKLNRGIRYANSCRDTTSLVPQDMVALHAAVCSRALRVSVENENAYIKIWKFNPMDLTLASFDLECSTAIELHYTEWTVCTDQYLVDELNKLRTDKLPNETGGILLGSFDMDRKIVYIVDIIASPPDSKEWPTLYIRGCQGLSRQLEDVDNLTAGRLQYIGEWHTHPDGSEAKPSSDDKDAFKWLGERMQMDGYPAVMLIVGEREYNIYVESIN